MRVRTQAPSTGVGLVRSHVVHSFCEPASLPLSGEPLHIVFDQEPPVVPGGWNYHQRERALYLREARLLAVVLANRVPWLLFTALADAIVTRRDEIMEECNRVNT
jgi:hypothetical protein